MRSALNRCLKQRTCHSLLHSFKCLVIPASFTNSDMGDTLVLHNGLDICKVQVDQRRHVDQVRNALDTLLKNLVRLLQSLRHSRSSVHNLQQLVIRNDDQSVHTLF